MADSKGAQKLVTPSSETSATTTRQAAEVLTQGDGDPRSPSSSVWRRTRDVVGTVELPLTELSKHLRRGLVDAKRVQHRHRAPKLAIPDEPQRLLHLSLCRRHTRTASLAATPSCIGRRTPPSHKGHHVAIAPRREPRVDLTTATCASMIMHAKQHRINSEVPLQCTRALHVAGRRFKVLEDVNEHACVSAEVLLGHLKRHGEWRAKAVEHGDAVNGCPPTRSRISGRGRRKCRLPVDSLRLASTILRAASRLGSLMSGRSIRRGLLSRRTSGRLTRTRLCRRLLRRLLLATKLRLTLTLTCRRLLPLTRHRLRTSLLPTPRRLTLSSGTPLSGGMRRSGRVHSIGCGSTPPLIRLTARTLVGRRRGRRAWWSSRGGRARPLRGRRTSR